jgi:acyl-CoA reductase-like NAD-dependent aldehyde dehydrogenase
MMAEETHPGGRGWDDALLALDGRHRSWRELPIRQRVEAIGRLRGLLSREAEQIAAAIAEERGRALTEALSQEVLPVLEMARFSMKHMPRWLAPRRVSCWSPGFWQKKTRLYTEPLGTVLVLAPRNFPFSLGMMSLIYLALAGNTVLLKPAEESTLVGPMLADLLRRSGLEDVGAAAVLPGDAEDGARLVAHPVIRKVFFFGGRAGGEGVSAQCARLAKSCVLETGGGSTAFVGRKADLELAASGLAWSAFYARGQSCVATERICVEQEVAEEFCRRFSHKVEAFARETGSSGDALPYAPSDIERFSELLDDARAKGAVVRAHGKTGERTGTDPRTWPPTVILNASTHMRVFREEIFGPLVAVGTFPRLEAAVGEFNRRGLDLGASVWSRNGSRAMQLARSLRSRMVWINDSSIGLPGLPWGSEGRTGQGSLFSRFSLHEAVHCRWVSAHPGWSSHPRFWWNPYTPAKEKILLAVARFRY